MHLVQDLLQLAFRKFDDSPAVEYGVRSITYKELDHWSNIIAGQITGAGVGKGSIIGILTEDRLQIISSIIGVWKAGCAFSVFDPEHPASFREQRIQRILPSAFLVHPGLLSMLPQQPGLNTIQLGEIRETSQLSDRISNIGYAPDDICYIYFTSGSTGAPKGIAGRLSAVGNFIRWEIDALGIKPGIRASQLTNPTFDAFLRDVFVTLCAGGTVCIPPEKHTVLDGERLAEWLQNSKINLVHCVPSVFRILCSSGGDEKGRFSSMTHLVLAGEPLVSSDVNRWLEIFGDSVQLINLYGASEATLAQVWHRVTPEDRNAKQIPIGRPIYGVEILIFDAQSRICPIETVGEICIRSPYLSLGYHNAPELGKKVFVPDPRSDVSPAMMYRTGDLGITLENGELVCLGRRDQQVKVRGVRVETDELENEIRSHSSVKDTAVLSLTDSSGLSYLCAFLVLRDGTSVEEIKSYLKDRLPDAIVPSRFRKLNALPRTFSGKIDHQQLMVISMAENDEPDDSNVATTSIEEAICNIWREMLRLGTVPVQADFFALGGHSLMVMQMLGRVRTVFGVDIKLGDFLMTPTVKRLAGLIEIAVLENSSTEAINNAFRAIGIN